MSPTGQPKLLQTDVTIEETAGGCVPRPHRVTRRTTKTRAVTSDIES